MPEPHEVSEPHEVPEPPEVPEPLQRRRNRRRATAQQGPPQVARAAEAPSEQGARPASRARPPRSSRDAKGRDAKGRDAKGRDAKGRDAKGRGDRDLAGAGTSQVGPTGAMRARDLNRPTAEDLAEAEAELTIVRRNWTPATEAPSQPRRRRS